MRGCGREVAGGDLIAVDGHLVRGQLAAGYPAADGALVDADPCGGLPGGQIGRTCGTCGTCGHGGHGGAILLVVSRHVGASVPDDAGSDAGR
jgi:hypothetical protein